MATEVGSNFFKYANVLSSACGFDPRWIAVSWRQPRKPDEAILDLLDDSFWASFEKMEQKSTVSGDFFGSNCLGRLRCQIGNRRPLKERQGCFTLAESQSFESVFEVGEALCGVVRLKTCRNSSSKM